MPRLDIGTILKDKYNPERVFNLTKDTRYTAKLKEILIANQIRTGAGTDIFKAGGGGFITRSSLSESTVASGDFGNGDQVVQQVKISNSKGRTILAIIERAIYAGTDNDATYLLPGGTNIDESQFQVIGNNFSILDTSGNSSDSDELVNHLYIRNISAGATNLYIDVRVRYILNTAT